MEHAETRPQNVIGGGRGPRPLPGRREIQSISPIYWIVGEAKIRRHIVFQRYLENIEYSSEYFLLCFITQLPIYRSIIMNTQIKHILRLSVEQLAHMKRPGSPLFKWL